MKVFENLFNPNRKAHVSDTQSTRAASSKSTAPHSNVGLAATSKDPFSSLRKFEVVVLIDDSTSMAGNRWQEATRALQALAGEVVKYEEYIIKVQFLNSLETLITSNPQEIVHRFENFALTPKTYLGTKLGKLLDKYMKRLKAAGLKLKPAIFVVVTDGVATDGAQTEEAILRTAKALDKYNAKPEQISIQFVQVGNEPKATDYLQRVGDMLTSQVGNSIIIGATSSKPGMELDLVKILLQDTAN